jgi:hypothetical protein
MGERESQSGSNAGVVILIAVLAVAVICGGGVVLLGLGLFSVRAVHQPTPVMAPPPIEMMEGPVHMPEVEVPPPAEAPRLAPPINDAQPTPPSP